ncbi:MAG: twin-arginine translocation signal domain-containing protein [Chloroflexi bacterium]|nr:twin-arginine translocation signal domain-containing protein [Chloroflexota bacterium]
MSEGNRTPQEAMSRRELLKKVGAAGAILGARAIVPTNWAKPEIETGKLPTHAQTSQPRPQG